MLERILIALSIVALVWLAYHSFNKLSMRKKAKEGLGIAGFRPGKPGIVYFTMPGCIPCKTIQRPALNKLAEISGKKLQIIEVNAIERAALADSWGVLSVPTTFIIDSQARPRGVNRGVANADKLMKQLIAIGERPDRASKFRPSSPQTRGASKDRKGSSAEISR